jgi:hypothetical protein
MISNRGELARGWYERVSTALRDGHAEPAAKRTRTSSSPPPTSDDDSEDEFLPPLPGQEPKKKRHGPTAPKADELALQQEEAAEDAALARADLRFSRKADRKKQKEELEELVPRAEPGTRERQLEKKKDLAEKMRGFREKSPGGEVDEATLIGGGDESFAQKKEALERKKNERELRREQILKARIAEREERVQGMKEKEERTMVMLKALAESRFGGGGGGGTPAQER